MRMHPLNLSKNGKSDEVQKGIPLMWTLGMEEKELADSSQTLFTEYIYYVPFINIIYDILRGTTPDFDTIKTLIETNGVVSALIFSISMAAPFSMTYDDWDTVYDLFDTEDGPYYDCSFKYEWLISSYTSERNRSIYCMYC